MMTESRYDITDNGKVFRFKPNRYSIRLSVVVLAILIVLALIFVYYYHETNQGLRVLFFILVPYLIVHSMYDIFIRSEICYTFDKDSELIYRKVPFFSSKKLMSFDEAVIFISRTNRYWYYSLGARKSHLVKSYRISEDFTDKADKSEKQIQYENVVLKKIYELLEYSK
ncbi:hypothetical protein MKJ01_11600 [Chryseobacterium sp. SSA4.19]|uniref:hypothetical protein n=1 Tax=Chryseobacterium sp. SSA4.19 TaxID=2919915 RepID=UPI001F4D593C|nr:hypothetical protein [Chryseobacterium sp. SSA4.19]MCJ8154406.1 hypothetical protein [Chryseobacterium sp. SSA4.19]